MNLDGIWDHAGSVATLLSAVGVLGGGVWKSLRRMRLNDLHHLDLKMDSIIEIVKSTEAKLDRHLEWHLDHKD